MKRIPFYILIFLLLSSVFFACSSSKYLHDSESKNRQKEIKNKHSSNVFADILSGIFSIFAAEILDSEIDWEPTEKQFTKMNLINPSNDTLFVNMLTDVFWENEQYCDFMDMRIPPHSNLKLMLPLDTNYNLYFSNTPEPDDDEKLEINTGELNKISLYPGLTIINESENNHFKID